ncbi:MAG: hypothetical protein IPN92_02815 [Chromatiaceae bacterium]|nr:hypothetical protein [Chromatiaceae bacterium]
MEGCATWSRYQDQEKAAREGLTLDMRSAAQRGDVRVTAKVHALLRHADLADNITALDKRSEGNKISRQKFTLAARAVTKAGMPY